MLQVPCCLYPWLSARVLVVAVVMVVVVMVVVAGAVEGATVVGEVSYLCLCSSSPRCSVAKRGIIIVCCLCRADSLLCHLPLADMYDLTCTALQNSIVRVPTHYTGHTMWLSF